MKPVIDQLCGRKHLLTVSIMAEDKSVVIVYTAAVSGAKPAQYSAYRICGHFHEPLQLKPPYGLGLLYWSESYKHLHCSGKFHPKERFSNVFRIKEVVMRMFELVPVPVITDFLLVLFTKSLSFYAITFRKHTDAHRSRFNLLLLKKNELRIEPCTVKFG